MSEDTATRVWRELRTLVLHRDELRAEVAEALGISFSRARALRAVAEHGPLRVGDLASRLGTDPPYATLLVDGLVQRELVTRTPHPDDRRCKIVEVTAEGAEAAATATRILDTPPPALRALSAADLDALDGILTRLLAAEPDA